MIPPIIRQVDWISDKLVDFLIFATISTVIIGTAFVVILILRRFLK